MRAQHPSSRIHLEPDTYRHTLHKEPIHGHLFPCRVLVDPMLILDHLSDPIPSAPAGYVWVQNPGRPHQYSLAWDTNAAAARSQAETAEWTRRNGDRIRLPWEA